ncbi:MAG: MucB/RseB C-terminal domain-containing protein [Gammaproteobacteria bacterium]
MKKLNSSAVAWGFFALMMSAVAAAADADDSRQWLERMNQALVTRNYDGTFAFWQNGKVEMLRIIHRVKDGHVSERLVALGSGREIIRNGGELARYLPDQRVVIVEKRSEQDPLFGNFPTFDQASAVFYDIKLLKRTRIYQRDARLISVTPKDEFRYGYRLWIDEGTAMPLRTELCDPRGRVIEQLVLAENRDFRINAKDIPDSAFQPEVSTQGFAWRRSEPDVGRVLANNMRDRWNATRLPPGFRNVMQAAQSMPGTVGRVEHFVFSDGLASVSVFVETQVVSGSAASATSDPNSARAPGITTTSTPNPPTPIVSSNEVAQFGSTSAFSTVLEGRKITAVGEVPPETVRAIANSLQSVGGPPPGLSPSQPASPRQQQPAPSMSLQGTPPRH